VLPDQEWSNGNVHWTVTRAVNPLFEGRAEMLSKMEETIRLSVAEVDQRKRCCIVITGMGGQGKSEVCLQLANRVRQLYVVILLQ